MCKDAAAILKRMPRHLHMAARHCVDAILNGPWINYDPEYETRLSATREQARDAIARWPELSETVEFFVVHNSMNEACNGVRITEAEWSHWFSFDRGEVNACFDAWKSARAPAENG